MDPLAFARNEQFGTALEQVIDSLSFSCTHVADSDFRVHSKTTADTVASLQREQANRVAAAFGPQRASPEMLAQQLLALYQADAAAVVDKGAATSFDAMSDEAVKFFKKEMKQRIHEWEGAFSERTGREAAAHDKAPLRPIYELYKVVKSRVLREGGAAAPANPAAVQAAPASNASKSWTLPAVGSSGSAPSTSAQGVVGGSASGARPAASTGIIAHPPAMVEPPPPPPPPSNEELLNEKRMLKRLLHQFEANFEAEFGRKPGKDDRKARAKEYQRYGELKQLLNEHAKLGD